MARKIAGLVLVAAGYAAPAAAQLDPLLFIKDTAPFVLLAIDTSNRMQRGAPTDPADFLATSNYYDPVIYPRTGSVAEATLGVTVVNTTSFYRRAYNSLTHVAGGSDKFNTALIGVTTDKDAGYNLFEASTRLALARAAVYQAIVQNLDDVQFGLLKMRQKDPAVATQGNSGPVVDANPGQNVPGTTEVSGGKWNVSRPTVTATNGSNSSVTDPLVLANDENSNEKIQELIGLDVRGVQRGPTNVSGYTPSPLIPAGQDDASATDAPIKYLLDDARKAADTLIDDDDDCTNTIVVLITGGGEGTTVAGLTGASPGTVASTFLNVRSGRRVPIYVIAIAPSTADVANLKLIATNSGGQYFEITKAEIDAALAAPNTYPSAIAGAVVVPELVHAINVAVQHGLGDPADVNTAPTVELPFGPFSEFQVTSPVIGTVNLENAKDILGVALPNTTVTDKTGSQIPQRSNVLLTAAFLLPGSAVTLPGGTVVPTSFNASLRAFRQYKPAVDASQPSGYKFVADGTRLWVACAPGPTPTGRTACKSTDATRRNLFTAKADGTIIPFNTTDPDNLAILAGLMNLSVADATAVITAIRNQPLAAIVDSTPAIMNPPSLDPPPDDAYPGFVAANKDRRAIIWVGTNNGILEAIDGRLGVEVWGFIPLNLLPKLKTQRLGQGLTTFEYLMDGSAKVADVRIEGTCDADHTQDCWHTHLIIGEGPGGVFYQSFDVTLKGMASAVGPDSDDLDAVLEYFVNPTRVTLNWEFPRYTSFDPTLNVFDPNSNQVQQFGDLQATAPEIEKTVGQTWSDPAVGQVKSAAGPYAVLVGSGFLPYSTQQQTNRNGKVAGTTFYLLSAKDGTVYSTKDVGSDAQNETIDDCSKHLNDGEKKHHGKKKKLFGCNKIKNALQSDPVATGPADSRFISKAYMGDLDGRVWRFDIDLDSTELPKVTATTKLLETGQDQPIFSSMATVNVGGANQYIFYGTGSDLLPSTDVNTRYRLVGVLDNGASGTKTLDEALDKTNDHATDEKVTSFPAVAGDIVFFTTTTFKPAKPCKAQDANLYAFTFIGGAAYDSTGDNKVDKKDKPLVASIVGERATAPFIVDQHLVFGTASRVAIFGDSQDYNNGVGQAGVRILSWREVR